MRKLRPQSKKERGKKPFHISLTVFPIPFSLQSNECILHKIHTLLLLSSYHCKYQRSPSFRSTSRKDRLERLSPTVLSEVAAILCAHTRDPVAELGESQRRVEGVSKTDQPLS